MASGGINKCHSSVGFASNGWWVNLRDQVRLLRSHLLMSQSSDQKLEADLRALLSDYLAGYTSPFGTLSSEEALYMIGGQSHSFLEAAFMWLGGWRPTSVIILVHSVLGLKNRKLAQQSVKLSESQPKAVPLLSERQLHSINCLQVRARQAEHDLSNKLALLQMLIADQTMITALSSENWSKRSEVFKTKISDLRELLIQAEKLRKETLEELLSILNPIQAAMCSISALELIFAFKSLIGISFDDSSVFPGTVGADSLSAEAGGCKASTPSTILIIDASKGNAEDTSLQQSGSFSFESGPISGVSLASHQLTTDIPEKSGTDTQSFLI